MIAANWADYRLSAQTKKDEDSEDEPDASDDTT